MSLKAEEALFAIQPPNGKSVDELEARLKSIENIKSLKARINEVEVVTFLIVFAFDRKKFLSKTKQ